MKSKASTIIFSILFALVAIAVLWVGFLFSFACYMMHGLDLSSSVFGTAVSIAGMLTLVVGIVGVVLGIINLCKRKRGRAFFFALLGMIYGIVIYGGIALDEAISTANLEQNITNRMEELYGEDWNSPSAIEGIPETYQEILNQFYVVVKDRWPAERLMELGAVSMPNHYGDAALENIGFALMDLNGDAVDELVVGSVASEGGTAMFCIYADPENPFYAISSVEGQTYYLHSGETDGLYEVEIEGQDAVWVIQPADEATIFDFEYREGAANSADRVVVELIPFAQYK